MPGIVSGSAGQAGPFGESDNRGGWRWSGGASLKEGGSAEMGTLWERTLEDLRNTLPVKDYRAWILQMRPASVEDLAVTLEVPSSFCRQWISRHLFAAIEQAVARSAGRQMKVSLEVNPRGWRSPQEQTSQRQPLQPQQAATAVHALAGQTLSNFVVGPCNQIAFAAAEAVSKAPGRHYNPLFIHGGVGLGKTHLLNAVATALSSNGGRLNVAAFGGADFVTEAVTALRRRQMERFRRRFSRVDALLVDDVQFLAGKERTQEEFFHLFNELCSRGRQIVVTCDKPAREIPDMQCQIRSRFEGGLIVDVLPPEPATRLAILRRKANAAGMDVADEVLEFVAGRLESVTVRELEGILTRLRAGALHTGRPINRELASEVLFALYPIATRRLSVERIQEIVSEHFGVEVKEVLAKRRDSRVLLPRQIAMYMVRKILGESFATIGYKFSGRDHSTALHAVRVIEGKLGSDPQVRRLVGVLEAKLSGGAQPPA